MEILKQQNGDVLTLSIVGRLDTTTAPALEQCILDNAEGVGALVLDLKEMPYTSSAGLRVILKAQKLIARQGSMKIIHVQSDVMDIFEMTGFSDILTIEE